MPVTLKLTFPGGRYHATPWGRHVNEGVPEWPPSPWRLLRALVAVWKRTLPELAEEQVKRVLTALADPPVFHLPPHKVAHTRHYMPWEKKGPADRTLVFDTFVAVGRNSPVYVHWPDAALAVDDEVALRRLAKNLTTLGRAEGWVEAEVVSFPEGGESPAWNCRPGADGDPNPIPVLCPDGAAAFADDHYPAHDPKKLARGQVNPKDYLFACPRWHLCLDTETVHAARWPRVPGARWVNYVRPPDPVAAPARSTPAADRPRPTVARFLLDGPVLPLVTDTVWVAEAFRAAAMGQFERWCRRHPGAADEFRRADDPARFASRTLSGKERDGAMRTDHGHAFYLPTADGGDPRRITHVTVTAADGFGEGEVAVFNNLRTLRLGGADGLTVRVQLTGLGQPVEFNHWLFAESAVWESVTPFVAHRHFKRRGTKRDRLPPGTDWRAEFVLVAAREMIQRNGPPGLLTLGPSSPPARHPAAFEFGRRQHEGAARFRPCGFVRLVFAQPVSRTSAFGYASHYGLGLLRPGEPAAS